MEAQERKVATMVLPVGGKAEWTRIMRGEVPVHDSIEQGSPIVQASAVFSDGTVVVGGVARSDTPAEYNNKFMWVFDAKGQRYPNWPIDVGDHEDFESNGVAFSLREDAEDEEYELNIVEGTAAAPTVPAKPKAKAAAKAKAKASTKAAAKPKAKAKTAAKSKAKARAK
jgi:hypothetical protein